MSRRILVVPDKFKGTLTATAAAQAIARGWQSVHPGDQLELVPMSDGGDGFGPVFAALLKAERRTVTTVDAAHRPREASFWFAPEEGLAIIETADVNGLALLPPGKFHPFELDTFGLGALFRAPASVGARKCLVGVGGSSTNDGGFGLAHALGWRFLDQQGNEITRWTGLSELKRVEPPARELQFEELIVAVDVQNPLLGMNGATRIYGPQKGVRPEDYPQAESCLGQLAACMDQLRNSPLSAEPGTGAAGGLSYGLKAFLGGVFESGADLFSGLSKIRERVQEAAIVLTGEGAIDAQTLMGKGVGHIAQLCEELEKPCLAFAGILGPGVLEKLNAADSPMRQFKPFAIVPALALSDKAKTDAAYYLEKLAASVAADHPSPLSTNN